jgi:Trypsin
MRFSRAVFSLVSAAILSCGAQDAQVGTAVGAEGEANLINAVPLPQDKYTATIVWTYPNYGNGGFLCSGTMVSRNHILTAAHCVSAVATEKRQDADGKEYEAEFFLPELDPAIQGDNVSIAISDKRKLPNDIKSPLFKRARVSKVSIGSQWLSMAKEKPGYLDLVLAGQSDLAVIEVKDDLLQMFPETKFAQVDVRPVGPRSLMALTGYGCEQATFDETEGDTDNWGNTISAEYRFAINLSVKEVSAIESKWIPDYPIEQALEENTKVSQGYLFIRGEQSRRGAVSLCSGDSGSGAYRAADQQLVIGVNSGSTWALGKKTKTLTSWISRVDTEVEWLSTVLPAGSIAR